MAADVTNWMRLAIEIVACGIMLAGVVGLFIERLRRGQDDLTRMNQFLLVTLVLPVILILSLENILGVQTTSALVGVIVGYFVSATRKG